MTKRANIPNLERITFFRGQQLRAEDLTELQHAHRELRWLHNRSLHRWGIGTGLGVTGERGDTVVIVEPGYAVDCLGREIILASNQEIPVPAVAGDPGGREVTYYLVAAYQADDDQQVAERRPGVCLPEGTVRLSEEPRLEWRTPDKLQPEGLELVLAQAWFQNCQLSRPLSLAGRRSARLEQQPYIAAGRTLADKTVWRFWPNPAQPSSASGVETVVDTSAARFRYTPHYVAYVGGERLLAKGGLLSARLAPEVAFNELNARHAVTITDGTPDSDYLTEAFGAVFEELGGEVRAADVKPDDSDFQSLLTGLANAFPEVDILYFPISEHQANLLAAQAAATDGLEGITLMDESSFILLIEGPAGVVDATPTGFTLRVLLPRGLRAQVAEAQPPQRLSVQWFNPETIFVENGEVLFFRAQLNWHAVWMGIEG